MVAVVMEEGVAHLCFISPNTTIIKHKVLMAIGRKNNYNSHYDKQLTNFYSSCCQMVQSHARLAEMRCLIIASPGFVKDQFYTFLKEYYIKVQDSSMKTAKVLLVHSSGGYKDSLLEAC